MALEKRRAARAALALAVVAISCVPSSSASSTTSACGDEFFPFINKIPFLGPQSKDPFSFRYYNKNEIIAGKTMSEWLRFSIAFWHSFRGDGGDPFGSPTKAWPWDTPPTAMERAEAAMRANFELMDKLGVDFWCFHDRDIAPVGATLAETNANLDKVASLAASLQAKTGTRPLWGTAQLFKHPQYAHGAATSPNAEAFAFGAAQVKKAMEVTHRLGGLNYVFWGGREGYTSLLNTDMEQELRHQAAFLRMAAAHKRAIGFNGTLLIEPKPKEPTIHQYDWDAATTLAFLRAHALAGDFSLNIECNHATLAGHSCPHELETARIAGALGNIDANTGDPQTGWDTDEFISDPREAAKIMAVVLRQGGLAPGGINWDAKIRRESTSEEDLVIAHINGMDTMARGLRAAAAAAADGRLAALVAERYESYSGGIGRKIDTEEVGFEELEKWALAQEQRERPLASGRQELAERIFGEFI